METTETGTFADLQRFLAELEMPEVFARLWTQFQNSVPNIESEATVYFYLERNWPSHAHIHGWGARRIGYRRRGVEHYGFSESLVQLKQVEEVGGVVSIQTNFYRGDFFIDVSRKRLLGFLYFDDGRQKEESAKENS